MQAENEQQNKNLESKQPAQKDQLKIQGSGKIDKHQLTHREAEIPTTLRPLRHQTNKKKQYWHATKQEASSL